VVATPFKAGTVRIKNAKATLDNRKKLVIEKMLVVNVKLDGKKRS
jgi:hypothetical protein